MLLIGTSCAIPNLSRFTSALMNSGSRWPWRRSVIFGSEWPSSFCTETRFAPSMRSTDAYVRRMSWKRIPRTFPFGQSVNVLAKSGTYGNIGDVEKEIIRHAREMIEKAQQG